MRQAHSAAAAWRAYRGRPDQEGLLPAAIARPIELGPVRQPAPCQSVGHSSTANRVHETHVLLVAASISTVGEALESDNEMSCGAAREASVTRSRPASCEPLDRG